MAPRRVLLLAVVTLLSGLRLVAQLTRRSRACAIVLMSVVGTLLMSPRPLAAQFGGPCETWISITGSPPSPTEQATGSVMVEWGDFQTGEPACLEGGASNFQFTVNGVNYTGNFSVGWNFASGTVPLEVGWNELQASMDGYDGSGNPQTQFATRFVQRTVSAVYGVAVEPDGGTDTAFAGSTGNSLSFTVTNTGNGSDTFTFSCVRTGAVTSCSPPGSVSLGAGGDTTVTGSYDAASSSGSGSVTVTAASQGNGSVTDPGSYNVTVQPPSIAPVPTLVNHNGDNQDRGLCLTAAAGDGAAVQCGDLLVSHAMPVFRSMGKDRALTLVYSSATAEPRPRVAAEVQIPIAAEQPQSIYAELTVGGVVRASATYSPWAPGVTRQIVLAFDASDLSTGLYPFTLMSRSVYATASHEAQLSDTLIVVNRETSEFGAGWYLAGVEQLFVGQPGGSILWVGGDGSAKRYRSSGSGQWQAPPGAFRDLIVQVGQTYERRGKHGVTVTFDALGRHISTRNRLGHVTTFTWDAGTGRLTQIRVPRPGG